VANALRQSVQRAAKLAAAVIVGLEDGHDLVLQFGIALGDLDLEAGREV
jgi:hypothetical protein